MMKATTMPSQTSLQAIPKPTFLEGLARRLVLRQLAQLEHGELVLLEGHERLVFGQRHAGTSLRVTVHVHDPRFYGEVAFGGSIGAGEAYMRGYWTCDDLTAVVRLLLRNREVLDGMETGLARLSEPVTKILHRLNHNTRHGSRRNIAAHYDLGNDFFALFLDETMMYSSAIFERPGMTLREASVAKLERICRKLKLSPADHVLEIGTGWGGFALHAAGHYGCRVTTTTISRAQHELAMARVRAARLDKRVTVLLEDYRDLAGRYDKLVSVEMIEAVGHEHFDAFFAKSSALLEPHGMMLLQAITIADQRYQQARRSVDFIQRYIFPGGSLPSVAVITDSLARMTDMRVFHMEDIGSHYATTLRRWRDRFFANLDKIRALGCAEEFIRMWEFYLCYCEGGFAERAIGTVQMLLTKPDCRRAALVPDLST